MKAFITVLIVGLLSACATAPATAGRRDARVEQKEVICSSGALALYALTKPWALKDCISGENQ